MLVKGACHRRSWTPGLPPPGPAVAKPGLGHQNGFGRAQPLVFAKFKGFFLADFYFEIPISDPAVRPMDLIEDRGFMDF